MKPYLVDVSIALIFFARSDTLKYTFESVKKIKPSKLYLIQDGPRDNKPNDITGIVKCRFIVEDVDWECEIFKNYAEKNLGCGHRVETGINWVFQHEESALILEDDCVVEPSFALFAKELLEKYKDDKRVSMISALNHFESWETYGYDYFFAHTGAIAAWATWKRAWEGFDYNISDFKNPYIQAMVPRTYKNPRVANSMMNLWNGVYTKGKNGIDVNLWDLQFSLLKQKMGGLCIVPAKNMSCNIGIGEGSTFSGVGLKFMKRSVRKWFYQETFAHEGVINHPPAIICDDRYDKKYYNIAYPNTFVKYFTKSFYKIKRLITK